MTFQKGQKPPKKGEKINKGEFMSEASSQAASTSGLAGLENASKANVGLAVPPPLPTEYNPVAQDDGHGIEAYPGFHISWWPNNPWGKGEAKRRDLKLFTADEGYAVNATEYDRDTDGHVVYAELLAYVESDEHYRNRLTSDNAKVNARVPKSRKRIVRSEEPDEGTLEEEYVKVGSQTRRVERDFDGFENPDIGPGGETIG